MYCGDETGSFIGDIGSHTARFGYGGEDCPKYVVPSYVAEIEQQQQDDRLNKKKRFIPTSCYGGRWASNNNDNMPELKSVLRMADTTGIIEEQQQTVVDPVRYLQQGDCVQDWNACEEQWQAAFDALHVRNIRKHTTGIAEAKRTASGLKSTSTTAQSSTTAAGDGKCTHPILAVSPGCTYRVGQNTPPPPSSSSTSPPSSSLEENSDGGCSASFRRTNKELMQYTELLFERLEAKAAFVAPTPQLAAFSVGRQTAVVVDVGAAGTRVTPVNDGLVLRQAQRRSGRGGDWLSNVTWKAADDLVRLQEEKRGNKVSAEGANFLRPRYQLQRGRTKMTTAASAATAARSGGGLFHRWAMQDLMFELRTSETVELAPWSFNQAPAAPFQNNCTAKEKTAGENDKEDTAANAVTYELPDGTILDLSSTSIGRDLRRVPELFFSDQLPFPSSASSSSSSILAESATLQDLPLHKLVHSALSAVSDVDVRKELASNIVLLGASSLYGNMDKRLSFELARTCSSAYKTKVVCPKFPVERAAAAWIGGSVLTSLGSFQQLWLSKAEYEEYGAALAIQRFP